MKRRRAWSTVYIRTRDEQTIRVFTVFRELFTVHCFENPAATDVVASRSVTDSEGGGEGGSNRPRIELGSLHVIRFCSHDRLYLAMRVTNYGEKNTISVKNATSIRKDAGLPRSSWSRTSFVPRSVKLGGGARPPPASGNARACPNTPELRYISTYGVGRLPPAFRRPTIAARSTLWAHLLLNLPVHFYSRFTTSSRDVSTHSSAVFSPIYRAPTNHTPLSQFHSNSPILPSLLSLVIDIPIEMWVLFVFTFYVSYHVRKCLSK